MLLRALAARRDGGKKRDSSISRRGKHSRHCWSYTAVSRKCEHISKSRLAERSSAGGKRSGAAGRRCGRIRFWWSCRAAAWLQLPSRTAPCPPGPRAPKGPLDPLGEAAQWRGGWERACGAHRPSGWARRAPRTPPAGPRYRREVLSSASGKGPLSNGFSPPLASCKTFLPTERNPLQRGKKGKKKKAENGENLSLFSPLGEGRYLSLHFSHNLLSDN